MSISILKRQGNNWSFISRDCVQNKTMKCSKCDFELDIIYSYIILKLQQSNLLPENYKPMCCMCDRVRKTLEHYQCGFCNDYIDFEYFPMFKGTTYRVVCNTKGCKFKKKIVYL